MSQVCLSCGEPYSGRHDIPKYAHCDNCGEKTFFGPEAEYEHRQS